MNPIVRDGMGTPWGRADFAKMLCDGIGTVGTPSHGGIRLSPERNEQIPQPFRSESGWYEEDCEWAIPFFFFAADIQAGGDEYALKNLASDTPRRTLINWWPDAWQEHFGVTLTESESYVLKSRAAGESWAQERAHHYA